jgi:hypothetical protein
MDVKYNIEWYFFFRLSCLNPKILCSRLYHRRREYRSKGNDSDPPDELPLEQIPVMVGFTESGKPGLVYTDFQIVRCRSPPHPFWFSPTLKIETEELK